MLLKLIPILLILASIQNGLFYAIMALGIYITFRILDLPDLTVDGSFVLGMAVTAVITINGYPILALLVAMIFGALAGTITGLLQTKMKVNPILSGILVMTSLYSINLYVMGGKSNLSLLGKKTIFTLWNNIVPLDDDINKIILGVILSLAVALCLTIFFKTRIGLAIRATGDNEDMVRSSSINADFTKCLGLALGNGLVALSAGLITQFNSFADVTYGTGMMVIGLASVIIGEAFFGKRGVTIGIISTIIGSISYWFIIAIALRINILPAYTVKLISSFIVAIALLLPRIKKSIRIQQMKRRA